MRKFGLVGLWIRSLAIGPLALIVGFLVAVGALNWWRRRRGKAPLSGGAVALSFAGLLFTVCLPYPGAILELPLWWWATALEARHVVASAPGPESEAGTPVVFVLGGGMARPGMPNERSLARIAHGLAIWQEIPDALFLFSEGGLRAAGGEAWLRRYLEFEGVPPDRIVLETRARSTHENLLRGRQILEAVGAGRVVIVTSRRHVPRAFLVARKEGVAAEMNGLPGAHDLRFYPRWGAVVELSAVLNEYVGIFGYWLLRWL